LNENEKLLDFLFSYYLMRMFDYIRLSLTADDSSALIAGSKLRVRLYARNRRESDVGGDQRAPNTGELSGLTDAETERYSRTST